MSLTLKIKFNIFQNVSRFGDLSKLTLAGATNSIINTTNNRNTIITSKRYGKTVVTTMCGGRKFTEFQLDALEAHNDYRSRHDAPLMELNLALCDYSTEWANCLADSNTLRHNRSPYGENIFYKTCSRKIYPDPYEPVMQWYSEMRKNDFKPSPYPSNETKHFTQVIWKSSTTLGVGYATNTEGTKLYVVCNYHPAGNIYDEFMENVQPLKRIRPNCLPSIVKVL